MEKKPFVTKEQLEKIVEKYPTPFHLYDEKGIRQTARDLYKAFSWNEGFKEYFAVKATPTPAILKILKEEGCGTDCSSLTELMMSDRCGFADGDSIMFSSNETPAEEFVLAKKLGAIINLDDITHIDFLKDACGIPERICCRYNPGGYFSLGTDIMDNPGDAKYGMTKPQIFEAFKRLKREGVKEFGIHSFLASNTVSNEYYPALAAILFNLAVELKENLGVHIGFINLSGGVGIPYTPDKEPNDIFAIGEGVRKAYKEILVPAGMGDVKIFTELGRYMLAPHGHLVVKAIQRNTHIKSISVLMHVQQISCALLCMVLIIILQLWVRRMNHVTIFMMLSVPFVRTMINSQSTESFRRLIWETYLYFMIREHMDLRWDIIIMDV